MTIEEARSLIPPGYVECDVYKYNASDDAVRINFLDNERGSVYAIPAPKEPRRVPMGEMVVEFNEYGGCFSRPECNLTIRNEMHSLKSVANTKWRLDTGTREWVEVLEC